MIAAVILTLLPELLRGLNDYRMLIYAVVLIVMMLLNWSPKATGNERASIHRSVCLQKEKKQRRRNNMEHMLEVKNLSISFGGLRAVSEFQYDYRKRTALRPDRTERRR